jgi:UDP-N-acetylmuramyl pentapeptide synthase
MANNVSLHDDGFIEISVVGNQTEMSVRAMGAQTAHLLQTLADRGRPLLVLDDITHLGRTNIGARQTVAKLAKTLHFDRLAMLGDGSTMMRVGTNLMLSAIGKGNKIRYFDNRDEAIAWLFKRR